MRQIDFLEDLHGRTKRDYLGRVTSDDKAACAEVALRWDRDYWDGDRRYGYGGYRYDGRWRGVAERMAAHYGLAAGQRVLDIGCGKAFLLFELGEIVPGLEIAGLDISAYAVRHAKSEVRSRLCVGNGTALPFADGAFDLVYSLNVLHNLHNFELDAALREMTRVGRGARYLCVESYRTEREKVNLLYWQLTCRTFLTPSEWRWLLERAGYDGDYGFIFFA
jgi:SAM-dependent methyltransferase